uniref:Uncharacterized protein n=1 Tax=Arcella intermedia TaxID=1963864 RepID=A0A6B2L4K7_9EUKA
MRMFLKNEIEDEEFKAFYGRVGIYPFLRLFFKMDHSGFLHEKENELPIEEQYKLNYFPSLNFKTLEMAKTKDPQFLSFLIFGLYSNSRTTFIDFKNCAFNPWLFTEICEALKKNNTITSIDLSENLFGEKGIKSLSEVLRINTTITSINLYSTLKEESSAQTDLVGSESIKLLADALKINSTLTSINLSANAIRSGGTKFISDCLRVNTTIKALDLSYNDMQNEGAEYISECLKVNTTITSLNLSYNYMDQQGIQSIEQALKENTSVTQLLIYWNKATDDVKKAISVKLAENEKLNPQPPIDEVISYSGSEVPIESGCVFNMEGGIQTQGHVKIIIEIGVDSTKTVTLVPVNGTLMEVCESDVPFDRIEEMDLGTKTIVKSTRQEQFWVIMQCKNLLISKVNILYKQDKPYLSWVTQRTKTFWERANFKQTKE